MLDEQLAKAHRKLGNFRQLDSDFAIDKVETTRPCAKGDGFCIHMVVVFHGRLVSAPAAPHRSTYSELHRGRGCLADMMSSVSGPLGAGFPA